MLWLTGASDHEGGGCLTSELIKQTILPKCLQVLKRRRLWSTRVRQHGPRAAERRPTVDVSDRTGGDPPRQRRAPEDGGQRREPRPLGRRPRHGGPAAHGGPLLEDGVAGLPRKQETSGGIFQECTVAVEGHCNKFLLTLDFGRFWKMTGGPTCGKKGIRQTKQAVG